jgi:phosphoribosylanthranilate isomerase
LVRRTRVKICGIKTPEIAHATASFGADAIGMVFYKESPRAVTMEQAEEICKILPPFVSKVGLFVDAEKHEIDDILNTINLDLLQFHGSESPDFCRGFNFPYIKVVRMQVGVDLQYFLSEYSDARALLLDTHNLNKYGGTGKVFDWSLIPQNPGKPIILAGGLNSGNVKKAIRQVMPYAVDVSGGVESEEGVKDLEKIEEFINEVNDV